MKELLNKKAEFAYEIINKYVAGIVLTGTEIKSIRAGKVNMSDSFGQFKDDELYIRNLHISEYSHGNLNNHEPKRSRKLLLKKQELRRLHAKVKEKGFSIAPLRLFFSETGFAKLEIGLVRGKKTFDKSASIKEKDRKRDADREMGK